MKYLFTSISLAFALDISAQGLPELSERFQDPQHGFLISYPEGWDVQTEEIGGYAVRLVEPEDYGSVYVKVTEVASSMDAKTIITDFIEPSWREDGAEIIPQTEDERTLSEDQLFLKNAQTGYRSLVKYPLEDGHYYIGYIVLTKNNLVYEIKHEANGLTPRSTSRLLATIGLSLVAL